MSNLAHQFNKKRGDIIKIPDPTVQFNAVVDGIDRYTELTATGRINTWVSYTVISDAPKGSPWERFYLVDGQADKETGEVHARRSYYVLDDRKAVPDGFKLDPNLSGFVKLKSEGDAALSNGVTEGDSVGMGALFTYKNDGGDVWAEEVFNFNPDPDDFTKGTSRLAFRAIFEEPEPFQS